MGILGKKLKSMVDAPPTRSTTGNPGSSIELFISLLDYFRSVCNVLFIFSLVYNILWASRRMPFYTTHWWSSKCTNLISDTLLAFPIVTIQSMNPWYYVQHLHTSRSRNHLLMHALSNVLAIPFKLFSCCLIRQKCKFHRANWSRYILIEWDSNVWMSNIRIYK